MGSTLAQPASTTTEVRTIRRTLKGMVVLCIVVPLSRWNRRAAGWTIFNLKLAAMHECTVVYSSIRLSRNAFVMTETELKLMAAAAIMGLSRMPKAG